MQAPLIDCTMPAPDEGDLQSITEGVKRINKNNSLGGKKWRGGKNEKLVGSVCIALERLGGVVWAEEDVVK